MSGLHPWLRLVTATGLAVDAVVHWHLAVQFDPVVGSGALHVSQGQLFRLEAVLAVVAAALVLVVRRRWTVLLAFLVAFAGVVAVLLFRYVDLGAFGPVPDMYDPTWYPEKNLSVVAEAVASVAAAVLLLTLRRERRGRQSGPAGQPVRPRSWAQPGK